MIIFIIIHVCVQSLIHIPLTQQRLPSAVRCSQYFVSSCVRLRLVIRNSVTLGLTCCECFVNCNIQQCRSVYSLALHYRTNCSRSCAQVKVQDCSKLLEALLRWALFHPGKQANFVLLLHVHVYLLSYLLQQFYFIPLPLS